MAKKVSKPKKTKIIKRKKMSTKPPAKIETTPTGKIIVPVADKPKGRFVIRNTSPHIAKEIKPGIGTFVIPGNGMITVDNEELANSLVNDSQGHLVLEK